MKPFDIALAKNGASICTRDGRQVEFITLDWNTRIFNDNLVVKIDGTSYRYGFLGKSNRNGVDSISDLFLVGAE